MSIDRLSNNKLKLIQNALEKFMDSEGISDNDLEMAEDLWESIDVIVDAGAYRKCYMLTIYD